jgi:hypothetical protein
MLRTSHGSATRAAAISLLAALILPGIAGAKLRPVIPPGNSGANQYEESIPTARGGQPSTGVRPGTDTRARGGSPTALAPSTQRALAAQGQDGIQAAAAARATAPAGVRGVAVGRTGKPAAGGTTSIAPAQSSITAGSHGSGSSPVSQVLQALTGSSAQGGLGVTLPVILIITLLAAAILAMIGRRRRAT